MNGLVAIVGRPNVGKSTLFNRLVGMRQAIVDDTAGVTRDRHYGKTDWNGREFSVVDTGGYTTNSDDVFESAIRRQVQIAIDEADVILFMVEAATGITDYDSEIADVLDLHLLVREQEPVARKDAFQHLRIVPALLNQDSHLPPRPWVPP